MNLLREANANVVRVNPLPLPEGVAPTSKEIIACLNEYLIQTLQVRVLCAPNFTFNSDEDEILPDDLSLIVGLCVEIY